ncbi:MAG: hypothetical protein IT186_19330 [Acidobacteria bacterium]|nr:hypothetical protein [Acidobacteriota bacterium]MCG3195084.1 hypothetical protein [Thermoanaerobaculia bacterium]
MKRFALDQNFPVPIVDALREYIVEAQLVSVREIDERLMEMDDWELLLALHHHPDGWDGLITNDAAILKLPREMCVLHRTRLKLVIAEAAGHDPLIATGLVLANLSQICNRLDADKPQIWALKVGAKNPESPMSVITRLAKRQDQNPNQFMKEHGPSDADMGGNPLRDARHR